MWYYDIAVWTYLLISIFSLYGFCIFCYWWYKQGKASRMYSYITVLFLGLFIQNLESFYARYLAFVNESLRNQLIFSWMWSARLWIVLIIVILITGQMSYRMFIKKDNDH